jgi:hypothetical protein
MRPTWATWRRRNVALFVIVAGNRNAKEEAGVVTITSNGADHDHDATTDWSAFTFVPSSGANGAGPTNGDTITGCTITVCVSTTGSDEPAVTFWGEDVDTSAVFTTAASSVSTRTPTTAAVTWSVANLAAAANDRVTITPTTGTFEAIVQELVDRGGWTNTSPITFLCQGRLNPPDDPARDLQYRFYNYLGAGGVDPAGTYAPQMTLTWTSPGGSGGAGLVGGRLTRSRLITGRLVG